MVFFQFVLLFTICYNIYLLALFSFELFDRRVRVGWDGRERKNGHKNVSLDFQIVGFKNRL
jgi:hypothetical protein